ncbi:MAG: SusC/RagA family TonB-linked outer membrane protein [Prolixibacteraceae bacterium]
MIFPPIFFQKFRFIGILVLCLLLSGSVQAQKKAAKKLKTGQISMTVVDEKNKTVPSARVVVGEGIVHTETDANGMVSFQAFPTDFVTVSSPGFEKTVVLVENLITESQVILVKSKFLMTSDDDVPLPFMTLKKRNITGSSKVLSGNDLDKYPSTDLRNSLTGLYSGLDVVERYGTTGMSAEEKLGNFGAMEKVNLYMRGRSPIFIIDDVPTDITEMQLDPQEIESATILKDIVAKTMFGPQAADGAIFIKTKRGKKHERILNVNAEYGISQIDRFPGFVSGSEYATLNNLARKNSGLTPNYTDNAISKFALNNPYDMYFPSSNFRELMLKNQKSFRRANVSSQGGNDVVQYYANLAYDGDGDIYKIGKHSSFDRISTRANLDIRINELIKVQFDFYGGFSTRSSPNYGYDADYGVDNTNDATLDIYELDRLLDDITSIPPIAFPIYANNDPSLKKPWYGVSSSTFTNNPVGRLVNNGYYNETGRSGNTSLNLYYDLKNFLPGLKSKTFVGFQAYNLLRIGKEEDYIAYFTTPALTTAGKDTILLTKSHDGVDMPGQAKLHDYYYQRFGVYQTFSYDKSVGDHNLQSSLTYYISKTSLNGIEEPRRQQNGVVSGIYTYKDKLSVHGVANYAGTYSFAKGKRYALFPAIGVGWVVSEEKFMSKYQFVDFLKVRAEIGSVGYEANTAPYYYNSVITYNTSGTKFGPAPTGYWFGSAEDKTQYQTYPSRTGNPDITWETRKEMSAGIEAILFKRKLSVEVNYYNNLRDGMITQLSNVLPYTAGLSGAKPYFNYNKTRYMGIESSIQYSDKIGKLGLSIGGNATTQKSEIVKLDEPNYRFPYQSKVGQSANAYYGQTYIGKFETDADALVIPQLYDAVLHAGDLKYKDMNGDGVVDDNDISNIGNTSPKLFYSVNTTLSYKGFDFTLIGTGRAFFDIAMTNKYFWNGWGDNTYSNFVKNNIGGVYPRLTYNKVENNFKASNFWLTKGGFFKIQNVEFAYTLPQKTANTMGAKGMRVFVRGANLLTLTKIKDVDPESIGSGIDSYPLFKTFTTGLKITF